MKKKIFLAAIAGSALAILAQSCSREVVQSYPVYSGPLVQRRADPCVYLHTDGYYYYTNSYEYGAWSKILIKKSKTINGLRIAAEHDLLSAATLESWGVYAYYWNPELHFIQGKWYLFFNASQSSSSKWTQRGYVAVCGEKDPLAGNWTLLGKVKAQRTDNYNDEGSDIISSYALGGTVFCNEGQWYYLWTQTVNDGDSEWDIDGASGDNDILRIDTGNGRSEEFLDLAHNTEGKNNWQCLFIGKTSPEDFTKVTGARIIAVPEFDWECGKKSPHSDTDFGNTIDQPAAIVRNGKVIIVYSAGDTDDSYCMGLLTADAKSELTDFYSWKKAESPLMETNAKKSVYGPGSPFFTRDGDYDVMVFSARPSSCTAKDSYSDKSRATYAVPLTWSAEGLPEFCY